jgi:hypothetical protein
VLVYSIIIIIIIIIMKREDECKISIFKSILILV